MIDVVFIALQLYYFGLRLKLLKANDAHLRNLLSGESFAFGELALNVRVLELELIDAGL